MVTASIALFDVYTNNTTTTTNNSSKDLGWSSGLPPQPIGMKNKNNVYFKTCCDVIET